MIRRILYLVVAGILCACTFAAVAETEASDYLGELCWLVSPEGGGVPGLLKIGVTYLGGTHLLLSGKVVTGSLQVPVYGNITIFEGLMGTLISSGFNADFSGNQTALFTLFPGSVNGYYGGLSRFFVYSSSTETYTEDRGLLTFVSCPPAS